MLFTPKLRTSGSGLLCLVAAILASVPAWIVKYPPIQDLPYHVAAIRVLRSFSDPSFGFDQHFQLQLGNTHYLLYYVVGSALAYVLGITAANVVLLSACFTGMVLALRSLLHSMGRDPRASLLVIPLLSNVLMIYGLLPFLLGLPLMFWGLSVAIRHAHKPTWTHGITLLVVSVACFYTHIIPFGLFGIGCLALFPWFRPSRWAPFAVPLVPALGLCTWWTTTTSAGQTTRGLLTTEGGARNPEAAIADIPNWLVNIFRDNSDEKWFIAWILLVVVCAAAGLGEKENLHPRAKRYAIIPLVCVAAYFTTPVGHDFIWPLSQRFAILALMTMLPLLPYPRGWKGHFATLGALVVAAGVTYNTSRHFVKFQLEEVGDFDDAKAVIERGSKVCTLIFDKGSNVTHHQAFLHFGSWVQAEKGGVVMFTFAGYPHWPFDFQPDKYPPPGGPARRRWEWTPERVGMREIYPYYDYVLVRGKGFSPIPGQYDQIYHGSRWTVWKRTDPQP